MQSTASDAGGDAASRRARARRGLAIYFAVLLVASGACEALAIATGQLWLIVVNMWMPTVASVVARLVLREGFGDVSFRWGGAAGTRAALVAWSYPLAVGLIAYGTAWATGLATFSGPSISLGITLTAPLAAFSYRLLLAGTVFTAFSALSAAGEEIGWRGYMLPRLVEADVPRPVLLSGLIWAGWHLPLMAGGLYAVGPSPWLSPLMFVVGIVAESYLIAKLRLESGSVWPAILAHASWNALIQGAFDRSTEGVTPHRSSSLWVGESGILVALSCALVVAVLVWRPWVVSTTSPPSKVRAWNV